MTAITTPINSAIISQILYAGSFAVFFGLIVVFIVLSAILNYHWSNYDIKMGNIKTVIILYFTVSLVLFYGMAIVFIFIIL